MSGFEIKVCGLREPENIVAIDGLQPERIGLILTPKSKRYASRHLSPEAFVALGIVAVPVGVFVNQDVAEVAALAESYQLGALQLHGDEMPTMCERLRERLPEIAISKAFGVDESFDLNCLQPYEAVCDYFVLDTKTAGYGGSGRSFDRSVLEAYPSYSQTPFLLAGGLGPENVGEACRWGKSLSGGLMMGVDINSCVEVSPGRKDVDAVATTIRRVREAFGANKGA